MLRAEGRPREALSALEPVIAGGFGSTYLTMKLSLVEALEAAFALGDRDEVEEQIERIEALRPGERPLLLEAHAHRFRAKLTGDEAGYRAAAVLFRERSLDFWLAVTLLEHGEAVEREPLVAEAREIFERLGATPWLERAAGTASKRRSWRDLRELRDREQSRPEVLLGVRQAARGGLLVLRRSERAR